MSGIMHALLLSTTAASVSLVGGNFSRSAAGAQTCGYRLTSLATEQNNEAAGGTTYVTHNTWGSTTTNRECRMTMSSGTFDGSALSTWLDFSTLRTWSVTDSVIDGSAVTGTGTIEIRDATTLTVLDAALVILTAQATF